MPRALNHSIISPLCLMWPCESHMGHMRQANKQAFPFQEIMDMDHVTYFAKWPHTVSRTMTVLSTVTNPVLYLTFSDPFRKALVTICRSRPTSNSAINQTSVQETSGQPMTFINTCICCPCRLNRVMPGVQPSTTQSTV